LLVDDLPNHRDFIGRARKPQVALLTVLDVDSQFLA